jgi:hypothetical protein
MAVTISVEINDVQQAKVETWVRTRYPSATNAQIKARLETAAARGIRAELQGLIQEIANQEWQDKSLLETQSLEADFPDPDAPEGPAPIEP